MPEAGELTSWAPLSSSASSSDVDPPADDEPQPLPCLPRALDRPRKLSCAAADQLSDHQSDSCWESDFYRRYSELWERSRDSQSSWGEDRDAAESAATCYTEEQHGWRHHDDDDSSREDDRENRGLLWEVPFRYKKMASWSGQPDIKGRTEWVRMVLLCAVHFGITFTWGVEMTYCTPYLLNLGLTKSQTSLAWIAGPLSGLIVQPIVGALADSSRSKWGRRRPYILAGSAIVAGGLITLGWTKDLVSVIMATDTDFAKRLIIFLAVLALYVTDFAINAGKT